MKKILILIALLPLAMSCTKENLTTTASTQTEENVANQGHEQVAVDDKAAPVLNSATIITITDQTRGFSETITIKNKNFSKTSTGVVPPSSHLITNPNWNLLKTQFSKLKLNKIATYPAPSCLRCSDSDLAETLVIKHNGVTYTSNTFDKSNPPAALKNFLNCAKSI